jgi:hypothetical protein
MLLGKEYISIKAEIFLALLIVVLNTGECIFDLVVLSGMKEGLSVNYLQ